MAACAEEEDEAGSGGDWRGGAMLVYTKASRPPLEGHLSHLILTN